MSKDNIKGLAITGRLKESGITLYVRNGKTVARTASSYQPKRRTRQQFVGRQQLSHSSRLWATLKYAGEPLFPAQSTAYNRFISLMRRTQVVFMPQYGPVSDGTLLLPDMPISEGVLPVVWQHMGEVDGSAALITSLKGSDLKRSDRLLLYTLKQVVEGERPKVRISRREVNPGEMVETDGGMALVGNEFADEMSGWALVHVSGERCSSQIVVTQCTYYQQFTTEEALQEAAKSYGGLTKDVF